MTITKDQALEVIKSFSGEEIDGEELISKIFDLIKIAKGTAQLDGGMGVPHDEVFAKYGV